MKSKEVVVHWREGLHLRPAARLGLAAKRFHSTIHLRCNGQVADLRNILSIVMLCAAMGTTLVLEVSGDDEQEATQAIEQVFLSR